VHEAVELVVTEGYSGTPLRGHEPLSYLEHEAEKIETLWKETLQSLAKIQPSGATLVGVWPALETSHGSAGVDLSEELHELSYVMTDALGEWGKEKDPLVYGRADQFVKRRIVVLKRI
jgi:hypothetical protein